MGWIGVVVINLVVLLCYVWFRVQMLAFWYVSWYMQVRTILKEVDRRIVSSEQQIAPAFIVTPPEGKPN